MDEAEGVLAAVQALLDAPGAVHPPLAPQVLVNGKLVLAQLAAILHYLDPRLGLVACDANAAPWKHQMQLTIPAAVTKATDPHHLPARGPLTHNQTDTDVRRDGAQCET